VTGPVLVHVDADLGGDADDACALAMLLGRAGVEVAGVSTNLDAVG
jgi:inosine-uridine nucleoside N-ribohydrolase